MSDEASRLGLCPPCQILTGSQSTARINPTRRTSSHPGYEQPRDGFRSKIFVIPRMLRLSGDDSDRSKKNQAYWEKRVKTNRGGASTITWARKSKRAKLTRLCRATGER
ncbi:hypothetical protein FGIG_10489 [Fasciola gigantica]|uniref:Uncharacterized protein n=1 Tax=Fasciola gigantica TaxID=46835 RepID=A0A504Y9C8_FASGI|nr:hypothetical protein FGIG_10489 [Fasciola gigantica]